ncbi:glycoside hydrolase family 3 C-terminal domain-containing protein [Sphingomonas sp. LB-2]|uniref:beta-glucosidase n=1 Tax=Sphingomonas caeni TaxID=2984949 RepID=UPI0022302FB0|nr:glycoside hydrolase family 3 C-terminal domain-containing protein [Sphingomonas caeni]MCW3848308.1 glycoside hydrolase family 3 C-terminal domain-containing protein [Sphingomonas caeni]
MIRNRRSRLAAWFALLLLVPPLPVAARPAAPDRPWMDRNLDPDQRARLLMAAMTTEEKLTLVHGPMGRPRLGIAPPERALGSAGFIFGIPRLGIPDLQEADASVGVTNPGNVRPGDGATAFPATIALASSWNRTLAYSGGAALGDESWRKGFNVLLAGGTNLVREPRNGRNFEYMGEDPLLAGSLVGDHIRGIQSQNVVSTIKHFAFNNQETARFSVDVQIGDAAARESDLLAFELAIEGGKPGSVMCAYQLVDGRYSCENDWLLNQILRKDWGYPGWVMSDWGAVHSTEAALNGLDQESGEQLDRQVYFGQPLTDAVAKDPKYRAQLDLMVHRILRSLFATGVMDRPATRSPIDYAANSRVSQSIAEEGSVLLKNEGGLLPLAGVKKVAVIGGNAQFGVPSGGGSANTTAIEGPGLQIPVMGWGTLGSPRLMVFHPSSPLEALREAMPGVEFVVNNGDYPSSAAIAAKDADVAIVFATQWTTESYDVPDLTLPHGQDALIAAVAAANPKTVVVLETGGPVTMPWLGQVSAVLEAWYAGNRGGPAIANLLTGRVNPSGRLAVSFPVSEAQLPRPSLTGWGTSADRPSNYDHPIPLPYAEGADVGYRWYARKGLTPLFPFGHGLSYTSFAYSDLEVRGGRTLEVSFTVCNTGERTGADVPQVYLTSIAGSPEPRLIGFDKVRLAPGETRRVTVTADPRLLAHFDEKGHRWRVAGGSYGVAVGASSASFSLTGSGAVTAGFVKP